MSQPAEIGTPRREIDTTRLSYYLIAGLILYLAAVTYTYLEWRKIVAIVAVGGPIGVFLLTQPRLAVYQFLICLYMRFVVVDSVPVLLADLSALLMIAAAGLDVLASDRLPRRTPKLAMNLGFLLAALILTGVFSSDMTAAFRPVVRLVFLIGAFLAMYRLSPKIGVAKLLRFYFWLCVAHSILVAIPFVLSGGVSRQFGLSGKMFDELAMFAVPIGLAFYLWSDRAEARYYLVGSMVALAGLAATQSRAPIFFAALAILAVLWMSLRRIRSATGTVGSGTSDLRPLVRKRIRTLLTLTLVTIAGMLLVMPGVFDAVVGRFERLLTLSPGGTFALRMVLWKTALTAFLDNPIFGAGPGMFRSLSDLYPTLHLVPVYYYVRALSAHNLVLHYLAETGLVGTVALLALFVNQFRIGRRIWKSSLDSAITGEALALYAVSILFLISTLIESGWMWGQLSLLLVFFLGLLARQADSVIVK